VKKLCAAPDFLYEGGACGPHSNHILTAEAHSVSINRTFRYYSTTTPRLYAGSTLEWRLDKP
jgi:hypothetical protein